MTVDEAIRKYRETINELPDRKFAVCALDALFSGVRAHGDYDTLLDELSRAFPETSREKHIEAIKRLVLANKRALIILHILQLIACISMLSKVKYNGSLNHNTSAVCQ